MFRLYVFALLFLFGLGAGYNAGLGNYDPAAALILFAPVFGRALGYL